jgi:hypothetical protein
MSSEADLPRSIRRGPPITIACECGERRDLQYGERWTCEQCGRTWNTRRVPLDEYADVSRKQLRYRWLPLAMAAGVAAALIVLIVAGRAFGGILLAALATVGWCTFGQARWHRRYLDATANRPNWTIEPE